MHASAFSLATSIPTILPCCAILPFPSLLVRALTPMQLCGLKEAPDLSLALPQGLPLVVTGSGPATGGGCSRPPVRIHSQISGTQGWPRRSRGRVRASDAATAICPLIPARSPNGGEGALSCGGLTAFDRLACLAAGFRFRRSRLAAQRAIDRLI